MSATKIRIYEKTLTDGSKVYGVLAGAETFDCVTEADAYRLADTIERLAINTEQDGLVELAA